MFKVAWLLKRKPGMSHAEFRDRFERTHAPMAQKYIGHLLTEYRRDYLGEICLDLGPRPEDGSYAVREWRWDLLSEWVMPDEAAFNEVMRIMSTPHIATEFRGDSAQFSDQQATVMIRCVVFDTTIAD